MEAELDATLGYEKNQKADFLTDKKVPLRFRDRLPVVADGKNVVCVCGVEISECAKVLENSENTFKINITSII